MDIKTKILSIYEKETFVSNDREIFNKFIEGLNSGIYRAAEKRDGKWEVNTWVKKGILIGFRMGENVEFGKFIDKDTYPERNFTIQDKVRLVPGGSSVRTGAYVAKSVTMMPPMYINVGAYVDEGTMIDSHALVGSCAQIGKNVHLSAAAQIGGVLEPIGANPVIIEDNVFIGGNCGVYEGVIVEEQVILAAGVILTNATPVYDAVNNVLLRNDEKNPLIIPRNAVLIQGTRKLKHNSDYSIYCPIIIKYRDEKSETSVLLEEILHQ
ncbi:MAG: 2,3,4,5-tetrahydropyridine-2,6-dicarboxylate N-succinyltransferase [Candidatus Cloacimonetes bacterium]|nr:2,3,4,5-tetrahydropyridine-2,6-dicarboxylate N-succinyltransferase [Candidatus Cloacimonadota bacterium]